MKRRKPTGRSRRPLGAEQLEPRVLFDNTPAQWTNALSLSLSFAPDGTRMGDQVSSLESTLDRQHVTQWKEAIARAFATWAQYANINVGVVVDGGQDLGLSGAIHGDERFGDIRIAGMPLSPDTDAEAVNQSRTIAGTWAGDIVFNTDVQWSSEADLYSVALHEAGHALGLAHSTDPASPMFTHGISQTSGPTTADITALQAIYGLRRADVHDSATGNETISKATRIPYSQATDGFDGTTPLVVYGDIRNASDVDVFELPVLTSYSGPLTFDLVTQGISQLHGKLTLTDREGNVFGQVQTSGDFGGKFTVPLPAASPGKYYLRVESLGDAQFSSGSYALVTKYDQLLNVPQSAIDRALLQGHRWQANTDFTSAKVDFRKLLPATGTPILDDDQHTDDSAASGKALTPTYDTPASRQYQFVGSISDGPDQDSYRLHAQSTPSASRTLTVSMETLEQGVLLPQITVLDTHDNPLPVTMIANGNGLVMLEVTGIQANQDYTVQVAAKNGTTGNYMFHATFDDVAATRTVAFSGSLTPDLQRDTATLYAARPQLFSFALASSSAASGVQPIWATVADVHGDTVASLLTTVGDFRSATSVLLQPGEYHITIEGRSADGTAGADATFQFFADRISDPVGPPVIPPGSQPIYAGDQPGTYSYPGGGYTTEPVVVVPGTPTSVPISPVSPPADGGYWPGNHAPTQVQLDSLSVPDNLPGATIGQLHAIDPDISDTHTYSVTDTRFEIVGSTLKLRPGIAINRGASGMVTVEVVATDSGVPPLSVSSLVSFQVIAAVINHPPTRVTLDKSIILANVSGSTIGHLGADDPDTGDTFSFTLSDNRFEVIGGNLRLKSGVSFASAATINVDVTAHDFADAQVMTTLGIQVTANPFPWHNSLTSEDVDQSGGVGLTDAMAIIRELRRSGSHSVASARPAEQTLLFDVNNNQSVDIQDAIQVIRYLRHARAAANGEGENRTNDLLNDAVLPLQPSEPSAVQKRLKSSPPSTSLLPVNE